MSIGKEFAADVRAEGAVAGDPALERFLSGDADAVAEALGLIRAAVNSRGFYIPQDDRPELVQEAMMQLLRHLADADRPRPRNFAAFVRTLAYRRCVDWMRRHPRQDPVPDDLVAPDSSPEVELLAREQEALGRRVLGLLGESCRDLIRRYTYGGATFRQIAEQDGRLEKTVRNQMYKCIDRARTHLDRISRGRRAVPRAGDPG